MAHMERKYFEIDEKAARVAHEMMSFREFREGSKTAEYKGMVDRAYALADRVVEKRPEESEKVYRLAERYSRRLAENFNRESRIGTMCPSIMISGGSNFPVRKKQRQVSAWENNHKEYQEIAGILDQIERIGRGGSAIQSNDENALEKLQAKLDGLKEKQAEMVSANRAIRMKDTAAGDRKLAEMGYSPEQIEQLRTPDFCGRIGYPSYALQNNNQNIHRIEGRIKELSAVKDAGTQEKENSLFRVVENTEAMRLQIIFDGKPEADVREVLKRHGFRWAPSQGAWQRQLNRNARYALGQIEKELEVE